MSGMKFRRTCTVCGTTFFSPDRKAAYCLKCVKKKIVKHVPTTPKPVVVHNASAPVRAVPRPAQHGQGPRSSAAAPRKQKTPRAPRIEALTPELRNRILEIYQGEFVGKESALRDINSQIATKLWIKRKLVADVLQDYLNTSKIEITPEIREKAIDMYRRFVETGYRPDGGRRHAISKTLGVPYKQMMKIIRDWAKSEYEKSPTPEPSRMQLFEIEKLYWTEMDNQRYRLMELPEKMADQLGYVTRWQILRWLDILHDDERAFSNVPDPSPEIQEQILKAYQDYLAAPEPPEHGLHYTIANLIDGLTPRQVHKVLQNYRHQRRMDYPLL
jgi:hypothetical protein